MSEVVLGSKPYMEMEASNPLNPTNKTDYHNLPENALCRDCVFFEGLIAIGSLEEGVKELNVICGSTEESRKTTVIIVPDGSSGIVYRGRCFNQNGYLGKGVNWNETNGLSKKTIVTAIQD